MRAGGKGADGAREGGAWFEGGAQFLRNLIVPVLLVPQEGLIRQITHPVISPEDLLRTVGRVLDVAVAPIEVAR